MTGHSRTDGQLSLFPEGDDLAAFSIRESKRAKRLSVRVLPHGSVEVVAPRGTRADEVREFVRASDGWIRKAVRETRHNGLATELGLPDEILFPACQESWLIVYGTANPLASERQDGDPGRLVKFAAETPDVTRRRLRSWVVDQGRRILLPRLRELSRATGLSYHSVHVGRQKTRWGSCTEAGRIHLNCALLFVSAAHADYVMTHELCHLREMNHSPAFWDLLESFMPEYRSLDKEMNSAWQHVPGWLFYG